MGEAISVVMFLALLGGVGYAIWRIVCRARNLGDPQGHPPLRVVGAACVAFLVVGTIAAPAEQTPGEPAAEQSDTEADDGGQRDEGDDRAAGRDAAASGEGERGREQAGRNALVTRVIDGDTVELQGVGRVRLTGVDTPERGEECYEEATDYLRGRVGGQTVRYRYQADRTDRYDRALLDLFRGGQLVNLDIAQAGWGEELTIGPNDRYAQRIAAAEASARRQVIGRWAGCTQAPAPPPEPEPIPEPDPAPQEDEDNGGGGGGGGGVPAGGCDSTSATDIPVPPGSPGDRDGDGIACES